MAGMNTSNSHNAASNQLDNKCGCSNNFSPEVVDSDFSPVDLKMVNPSREDR